jgi:hypothetical protein
MKVCLSMCMLKWRVLPLFLLMKSVDCLFQLDQPCPFLLNLLPPCLSVLGCGSPSCYVFLFLPKPLDLLLHLSQLFFCNNFIFLVLTRFSLLYRRSSRSACEAVVGCMLLLTFFDVIGGIGLLNFIYVG